MPHALLLSPDDQAVNAITGVLEEMSVTCERPLDGISAAQKLNSHSFDLVLVDCENLPAAKLIFDVCRRGNNGHNPVPIAIVDGRAGLPTAFRLGAELILTKPVAKDQARTTIRTAVSRVRKDAPADSSVFTPPSEASAVMPELRAQAATAAASSSQLTSFADPVPTFVASPLPSAAASAVPAASLTADVAATLSAPTVATKMNPAIDEAGSGAPPIKPNSRSASALFADGLASPEKTTPEPLHAAESLPRVSQKQIAGMEVASDQTTPEKPAPKSAVPVLSSRQGQQKAGQPLVALLALVLALGGVYAAWMYQPGFRAIAQPQINRALGLVGMTPPTPSPSPAKPSPQQAPATPPAPTSLTDSNKTQSTSGTTADSASTSAAATAPAQPPATSGAAAAPPASASTIATKTVPTQPETNTLGKSSDSKNDTKKDAAAGTPSNTPLPGGDNAIILSSKGAEKRLAYSIAPKYPSEAHSGEADATVVLRTLVDVNGKVEGVRLVEGNATLATAAIQAVKQWRYRPYLRDGKAQSFQTVVIVDFQHK